MDIEECINLFLDKKGLSPKAVAVQKSILLSFARWQRINPSKSLVESASKYRDYLDRGEVFTVGSRKKRCRLVDEFCNSASADDLFETYNFKEKVISSGELISLPKPVIDAKEFARLFRLETRKGWKFCRDATIALVAYSCCLSPAEIASLQFWNLRLAVSGGEIYLSEIGHMPLSNLTDAAFHVYLRGCPRADRFQPVFPQAANKLDIPMTSTMVRNAIASFASQYGYSYEELFHCSPQLTLARHLDSIGTGGRKLLAANAITLYFGNEMLDVDLITRSPDNIANSFWCEPAQ